MPAKEIAFRMTKRRGTTVKKPVVIIPNLVRNVPKVPIKAISQEKSFAKRLANIPNEIDVDTEDLPDDLADSWDDIEDDFKKTSVKKNWAKFADTELNLISGFPNVKFAYVTSPLSPRTNWASFFQQLNRRTYGGDHQIMSNVVSQQAISRGPSDSDDLDFSPEGDTADIYYNSIGRFTMEEGDAIALDVASEKTSYGELVEWIIPNNRNPDGRQVQEYEIHQNPEKYEQATWDAMKFKNPFKFPMTTASAMISSSGKFLGETVSTWVNPGQETVLQITKALSISTNATECEVEGKREIVSLGGHNFRKGLAEGVLTVKNHRKKNVSLQVKKCFSGNLKSAEENPKCELRGEGIYSVNKSNELIWDLELKPGEEKTLKYQYEVLVSN